MKTYQNRGGDSGIVAYDYDREKFSVQFGDRWVYEYPVSKIGVTNFNHMITLAEGGEGLNAFIMRTPEIRRGYGRKYKC